MNEHFIKTKDAETAEKLRKYLNELPTDGVWYTFVNDPTVMHFDKKPEHCVFTDKLNI